MTSALTGFVFWIGVGIGGAAVWFGKSYVQQLILGAEGLAAKLRAQANALSSSVTNITKKL